MKSASETVEEVVSVSEGEASVSENSCYSIPMASRTRRSREPLIKVALKRQRSITKAEQNSEDCVLVRPNEQEEIRDLMIEAYKEMVATANRLVTISRKGPKIRELAVSDKGKSHSV